MPVVISDETLRDAGLTEREALVEIACELFGAGKLALWPAARLAGVNRVTFEQALTKDRSQFTARTSVIWPTTSLRLMRWGFDLGNRRERHFADPGGCHLNLLAVLKDLFGQVIVPPAVDTELRNPPIGLTPVNVGMLDFVLLRAPQDRAQR